MVSGSRCITHHVKRDWCSTKLFTDDNHLMISIVITTMIIWCSQLLPAQLFSDSDSSECQGVILYTESPYHDFLSTGPRASSSAKWNKRSCSPPWRPSTHLRAALPHPLFLFFPLSLASAPLRADFDVLESDMISSKSSLRLSAYLIHPSPWEFLSYKIRGQKGRQGAL